MDRINKAKLILWAILGIAGAVAITRFIFGLGATTNLTDNTPWGFRVGFDVMGGVALAGGGFVIAAFNYIFGKKVLHPIARAAILTAFLGYVAVAVGLLFDLGLPWNIWHMIIYWNPHSPLFEVGWCVMLYLSVLTLEFTLIPLEKYPNIKLLSIIHGFLFKIRIPLVILGIMLSTLHQSSLGSLFLAMPYRLHPLWYSPIIPIIFFLSAICLGFMMVMVESMTSSYLYRREQEIHILEKIKKYASYMLFLYLLVRFADIIIRGAGSFLFSFSWGMSLFWIEILLSCIIPLIIFSLPIKKIKISILYFGAFIGVVGVVFNRLNVGGITHLNNLTEIGSFYFPSLMEFSISAGVVSAAMLIFFFFVENFKVWEEFPIVQSNVNRTPRFDSFKVYLGSNPIVNRTKFSFAFIIAFGLTFALISGGEIHSSGFEKSPVTKARGADTLLIDGNRDGYNVVFAHANHQKLGFTCGYCHHINKPDDKATGCYECHDDMYLTGDAFRHDWHSSSSGANLDCFKCHNKSVSKGMNFKFSNKKATRICKDCHNNIIPADSRIKKLSTYKTLSYTDAMHSLCIKCHKDRLKSDTILFKSKPNLAQCSNCHKNFGIFKKDKKLFQEKKENKWVVVP